MKGRYELVFLDLDDTLLDFRKAEPCAFAAALTRFGIEVTDATFERYGEVNRRLWASHERGEITTSELKVERFKRFREAVGLDANAAELSAAFVDELSKRSWPLPGSTELCRELASKYRLVIVSNGIRDVQFPRVAAAPFSRYVERVVVSEDAGCGKPDPGIFGYACAQVGFDPEAKDRMVVIGDSPTSDIAGGMRFGVDTVWLDRRGAALPEGIFPTYRASTLDEIRALL